MTEELWVPILHVSFCSSLYEEMGELVNPNVSVPVCGGGDLLGDRVRPSYQKPSPNNQVRPGKEKITSLYMYKSTHDHWQWGIIK